ncbi:hypothetical protein [Sphingomonas desiccabilis]|uniref:Uncharacterized protein n=1 Tax=Sphingomonas desiccabilis TaxID=429134 RepID=A0A4Q2IKZ8_9SPHN|nr:hypothetical protein [Sphingomonas desiccabilis]MBB3912587.1 hypothetical protein [Sphingomonas desiccabilis]RXZ29877.1 hypothetical protein EO081_16155 [Sphingomonas desiccabilis]
MQLVNVFGWMLSVAGTAWLLIAVTPRLGLARTLKWAGGAIAAVWLITSTIIVAMWLTGLDPPEWFGTRLFQLVFAAVIAGILSAGNLVFHGMVDTIIAFHEAHNAQNLERFPISFLIRHRRLLKRCATVLWCLGAGLMFYGVWTDVKV